MGWWSERVLPGCVDRTLSTPPVMRLRDETCRGLAGRVLEIGFGSGLNIPAYPPEVASVDAVEPSDRAWALSAERRADSRVPVSRVGLDGQRLTADDGSYDAVLSTFTLCTIPDVAAALAEVHRVLRPGGRVHLLEHGLAPDARVVSWQRRCNGLQGRVAGGCHLTRDVPALVTAAGFRVEQLAQAYLPGPSLSKPWGFVSRATAVRP